MASGLAAYERQEVMARKRETWPKDALPKGTRVRFTIDGLGASERDTLHCVTEERYGKADAGVVAFPHPNQRGCPGFVYVAVDSKIGEARTLYVGVSPHMIERV